MRRSTTKADFELIRLVAVAVAMLLVTFLVIGRTTLAFSSSASGGASSGIDDRADTPSSPDGSGSDDVPDPPSRVIALEDDDSDTALITADEMAPAQTEARCIEVGYTGGTDPGPVVLYRTGEVEGSGLEHYLDATIEIGTWEGSAADYPSCDGFTPIEVLVDGARLADVLDEHTSYESALETWDPAAVGSRVFRITLRLVDDNDAQGRDVRFGLVWEVRS